QAFPDRAGLIELLENQAFLPGRIVLAAHTVVPAIADKVLVAVERGIAGGHFTGRQRSGADQKAIEVEEIALEIGASSTRRSSGLHPFLPHSRPDFGALMRCCWEGSSRQPRPHG